MQREHRRIRVDVRAEIRLERLADRRVERPAHPEGQTEVRRLADDRALEAQMPVGIANEHARQALPGCPVGLRRVRLEDMAKTAGPETEPENRCAAHERFGRSDRARRCERWPPPRCCREAPPSRRSPPRAVPGGRPGFRPSVRRPARACAAECRSASGVDSASACAASGESGSSSSRRTEPGWLTNPLGRSR